MTEETEIKGQRVPSSQHSDNPIIDAAHSAASSAGSIQFLLSRDELPPVVNGVSPLVQGVSNDLNRNLAELQDTLGATPQDFANFKKQFLDHYDLQEINKSGTISYQINPDEKTRAEGDFVPVQAVPPKPKREEDRDR